MKLYYSPGACSLADHIALHEAGLTFDVVKVDLQAKLTEDGQDFTAINPKGYVPVLVLDDGETITENVAVLDYIAQAAPALVPQVKLARTRLLEMLAYISTELHKSFKPFFSPDATEAEKAKASAMIGKRLSFLAERMAGDYLFGDAPTVADAYLFVMLTWATKNGIALPAPLDAYAARMKERPAVRAALEHEGLA